MDPSMMLSKLLREDDHKNRLYPGLPAFRQQSWTKPNLVGQHPPCPREDAFGHLWEPSCAQLHMDFAATFHLS